MALVFIVVTGLGCSCMTFVEGNICLLIHRFGKIASPGISQMVAVVDLDITKFWIGQLITNFIVE